MQFNTYGVDVREFHNEKAGEFLVSCFHAEGDPEKVYRLTIESPCGLKLEITPSKGLSLRDCSYKDRQMFWDPPMETLPDPETVDLHSTVICDGEPVPGRGWVRYFASHVELLGLYNWGMERTLPDGRSYGLHGNASNVPVDSVKVEVLEDRLRLTGSYSVYGADSIFAKPGEVPDFRVEKQIDVFTRDPAVFQKDSVINLTRRPLCPDWGYHVQLRPRPECRYLIPSREVRERGGAEVPRGFETWMPAAVPVIREERGYVHRKLQVTEAFCDGTSGVNTLLRYSDGTGIQAVIPHSPYTMSWNSCGGGGGDNFLVPAERPGETPVRMLEKNWDGVGPEYGASDLDHGQNTDSGVKSVPAAPGDSVSLRLELRFLEKDEAVSLEEKILAWQKGREWLE